MNTDSEQDAVQIAEAAGLVYVHDDAPGITRLGKTVASFHYRQPDGSTVRDEATLARIRSLAIPPAYTQVWISPKPNGHIQATGRDARNRKQYRYHPRWREVRDEGKFGHMAAFGRALPKLRRKVEADLASKGLTHGKVTAAVIRLLEGTLIRVGNDEYARTNKSFGLTTLRNRHVKLKGSAITFEFKGKSGVNHSTGVRDRRLARIVKACSELPGHRLFQYVDEDGMRRPIGSDDVNAYLHAVMGAEFTAKDFRTWAGTLAAAKALALQEAPTSETDAKRLTNLCVKAAAGLLGNTPAVCRRAYIHPAVLEAFHSRTLPANFAKAEGVIFERAVLRFLDKLARDSSRPAKAA